MPRRAVSPITNDQPEPVEVCREFCHPHSDDQVDFLVDLVILLFTSESNRREIV